MEGLSVEKNVALNVFEINTSTQLNANAMI